MSDVDKSIDDLAEQDMAEEVTVEAKPEAKQKTEYIEFVGDAVHGTEFIGQHSVDAKHMKEYHDTDLGKKEVVWTKGRNGRYLVKASDITPEAAEVLENDPMFKRVSL